MDAYPGTGAKCNCEEGYSVPVPVPGQIIVDKVTVPAGASESFDFTLTGSYTDPNTSQTVHVNQSFSLTDTAAPWESASLYAGTYAVAETPLMGWTPTGVTCVSDQGGTEDPANILLDPGEIVTCTFDNLQNIYTLNVDKASTTTEISEVGQVVPYTFVVTNTGNQPLTGITVTDVMCDTAPLYVSGDADMDSALDLSETWTYTCEHTVTLADVAGSYLTNMVTVDSNESEPDTDDYSIPVNYMPAIMVEKSSTTTAITDAGQVVEYSFVVTNEGNVPLTGVTVSDPMCIATPAYVSGDDGDSVLGLTETWIYTCSHTVTQAEIDAGGNLSNTVTADSNESAPDDYTYVIPITQSPALDIQKTPDTQTVIYGQTANFTIVVSNIGNVTLFNITVSDPLAPACAATIASLAVGASHTYTCALENVTSSFTNVATASVTVGDTTITDSDDAAVVVDILPDISVTKTASPTSVPETGGSVTFTFVVTNNSSEPFILNSLTDDVFGDLDGQGTCAVPQTIAVGGTYTCSITELLASDSLAAHTNLVTAAGVDEQGNPDSATDDETVNFTNVAPAIRITKTANPTSVPETGGDVTFTFLVENTGQEDVTLTSLVDDVFGDLDGKGTCDVPQTILISGSYSCEYTVTLASDSLADHYNVATATAVDDDNTPAMDDDDETVTFIDVAPVIDVTKTADPTHVPETGGDVTFTFLVTNSGQEDVTLTSLKDTLFGDLNGQGDCVTGGLIAVGGSYTCSITVFLAADDLADHYNVVTAIGTDDDGTTATDDDDETVTFTDVVPAITITKTANPASVPETGGEVTFVFTVENIGSEDVTLTSLTDTVFGDLNGQGYCAVPQTILIGGSYSCSITKFISSDTLTDHYNVVTATAVDDDNTPATDTDDETVDITDVAPTILVEKTPSVASVVETGSNVTFTFKVTNTGTEAVTITSLSDSVYGTLAGDAACMVGTKLAVDAYCEFSIIRFVEGDYSGPDHVNVFTAVAEDNDGTSATDNDNATVDFTNEAPAIDVNKTVYPTAVPETGGSVTFTFVVKNTSTDESVTITSLSDSVYGALDGEEGICEVGTVLAAGAECAFSITKWVEGDYSGPDHVNVFTAIAMDNDNTDATDSDDATVTFDDVMPSVDLTKSVDGGGTFNVGDTATFTLVIKNTSPEAVTITGLTDTNVLSQDCLDLIGDELQPGADVSCTYTVIKNAAGIYDNTASVTVEDNEYNEASATDTESVTFYAPTITKDAFGTYDEVHDWDVFKTVSTASQTALAGQKVNFTWTVRVDETVHGEEYLVTGDIVVVNTNPEDAITVSLSDVLDDGSIATIGPCTSGTLVGNVLTVPAGGTATCEYSVEPEGDLDAFADALPPSVTMSVVYPYNGGPAYFPVTTLSGGTVLDGTYEGWCVDTDHTIYPSPTTYTVNVFSSYEALPVGLVEHPENFDLVNWIINQDFVGTLASDTLGYYTYSDVQYAIWTLIDDQVLTNGLYNLNTTRAAMIVDAARANGEGFEPTCGDFIAVVLQPVDGSQTITIAQVTFASVNAGCAASNTVTAVLNGIEFPASADIIWNAAEVNPTTTLDDDQKLDWPITVSADAIFTYTDPQGYTCPTDPTAYTNGVYTYNEDNTAVLGVGDSSTASTRVTCYYPKIEVTKTADPTSVPETGGDVTFTFVVKNISTEGSVTIATLSDSVYGTLAGDDDCKVGTVLAVNASCTFSFTAEVAGDFGGTDHVDIFTATAKNAYNITVSDTDDATVTFTDVLPDIAITKTANPTSVPETGADVTFTFVVTNNSLEASTLDSLVDSDFDLAVHCPDAVATVLGYLETYTCTFTEFISGDFGGEAHINTATVVASDGDGNTDSASDDATVDFTDVLPDISVLKTGAPASVPETGGNVSFTYVVTNHSTEAATITALTDDMFGTLTGDSDCQVGTLLAAGASCSFEATFAIPADDYPGSHTNTFSATVTDDDGNTDTATEPETITYTDVLPDIAITKIADPTSVPETGANVEFTIVVTNNSLEAATIDSLVDSDFDLAIHCPDAVGTVLAYGESYTCTFTERIEGDYSGEAHINTATVVASDNDANSDTASDDATVTFTDVLPDIAITKTANPTSVPETGANVMFTIVVTNNSLEDAMLDSLVDSDFDLAVNCPDSVGTVLGYLETYTCTFTEWVGGDYESGIPHVNTATVVASDNDGNSDTASDDATVTFTNLTASIDIEKYVSVDGGLTWADADTATGPYLLTGYNPQFKFVVANTGDVALTSVTLTDSDFILATCSVPLPFAIGATYECIITAAWAAGQHTDTADVTGSFVDGAGNDESASDTDDANYFGAAPSFTVAKDCASAQPIPQGGPAVFNITITNTGNVALTITVTEGTSPVILAAGASTTYSYTVNGPFSGSATVDNTVNASSSYKDATGHEWTSDASDDASCRVGSRVNVLKTTQGVVDPSMTWTFSLFAGLNGFGTTPLATASTAADLDGVLIFNNANLDSTKAYTLCENEVAAGWTATFRVDMGGDGDLDLTIPYNPNADDAVPNDLGNRCVDFGAGTSLNLLTDGGTLHFEVDNTYPGGEPRTPGYWKNWNTCTGGGQAASAAANGGWEAGFWLLDDVLAGMGQADPIVWDDILVDSIVFPINNCELGVTILNAYDIYGNNRNSDGAYTLAKHLLAAQLNYGAGARTCDAASDAIIAGETLLDKYNFDATKSSYLASNSKDKTIKADYALALSIAATLDKYNNGLLCTGPSVTFKAPLDGDVVSGNAVNVWVDAYDTAPVIQVEFFLDGAATPFATDTNGDDLWSVTWDSTLVADGSHTIKAVATNAGLNTGSGNVTVIVNNVAGSVFPPVVAITSPVNGALLKTSPVIITADASSTVGVSKVAFFVDGVPIGEDTISSDGWTLTWNSTSVADGIHTLKATAYATDGQTGDHNVSIIVDNFVDVTVVSLAGIGTKIDKVTWKATVTVMINPALAGAVVTGNWNGGSAVICTTGADGKCTFSVNVSSKTNSITFYLTNVSLVGYVYVPPITTSVKVLKP